MTTISSTVPRIRVRAVGDRPVDPGGDHVLYWMIAARRLRWNFALERAVEIARECRKPLIVLEALRCDYPYASDRLHRFILQGMAGHARRLERASARYYPYVEPRPGAGRGLLAALGERACAVVTDDYPAFGLSRMVDAAAGRVRARVESVDSNGLLPLRAADRVFPTAYAFRRFLQKELPAHFEELPAADPLRGLPRVRAARLPRAVTRRWKPASKSLLAAGESALARLPIDHRVPPVNLRGGGRAGRAVLRRFLDERLGRYAAERNEPGAEVASGLSPYLHFGHVAAHEVFHELMGREGWSPARLSVRATGSRTGWWGVGPNAEAFLDQLVTWRELGFNFCWQRDDYARFESLPAWALETLEEHAGDRRPELYTPERLERAGTRDELWNAAQVQLVREGRIHNYLRMLWGKKILEWSPSPLAALEVMIELNDRYALDGRDPNSYSGILWCLGRYDRPWGPERPIFGKVRYMSSRNTARKVKVGDYVARYRSETS